jgi:hypothetical protein
MTATYPPSRPPPLAGNNMDVDRGRRSARWRLGASVFAIERSVRSRIAILQAQRQLQTTRG